MIAVMAAVSGVSAGCSASPPGVSAADLQARITQTLTDGGVRGSSVRCDKDLPAKLGASVNCEVTFSPADRVRAVVTTTSVPGEKFGYEIQPRLTQSQVEGRVADMASAQSAVCQRGLDSVVGDWTRCEVTRAGVTSERMVEVTRVEGLRMSLRSGLVMNQGKVEEALGRRLAAGEAPVPDAVTCDAGLPAEMGATTECVATYGERKNPYTLTVNAFSEDAIDFDYVPRGTKTPSSSSSTTANPTTPPPPPTPSTAESAPPPLNPRGGAIGQQPKSS